MSTPTPSGPTTPTTPATRTIPTLPGLPTGWIAFIASMIGLPLLIWFVLANYNFSSNSYEGEDARMVETLNAQLVKGKFILSDNSIGKNLLFKIPNQKPESNNFILGYKLRFKMKVMADARFESESKHAIRDSIYEVSEIENNIPTPIDYGILYKDPTSSRKNNYILIYDIERK